MWKLFIALAVVFSIAALWDWRAHIQREWRYMVAYSFKSGAGRIFVTRSEPIKTDQDVKAVEQFVLDYNQREGNSLENLFLTGWVEMPS